MKTEYKGDIMLSAICVADQHDEESIIISSYDEKLRWWKLEYVGIGTFLNPADAKDALGDVECTRSVYEPDIIVKPLVDIETFEGKEECEMVPARYLFPMEMIDGLKGAINKCH